MSWDIKYGERLPFFEKLEASGREVKALQTRPTMPEYARYYYDIFIRLDSRRSMAMSGINAISVEAISIYCREIGADFLEVFDIISGIDNIYREALEKHDNAKSSN